MPTNTRRRLERVAAARPGGTPGSCAALAIASLLSAPPAAAVDGTYRGSATYQDGPEYCAQGSVWTLRIDGDTVTASVILNKHGPARIITLTGPIQPDGTVTLRGSEGTAEGRFTDQAFVGESRIRHCRNAITAAKSF